MKKQKALIISIDNRSLEADMTHTIHDLNHFLDDGWTLVLKEKMTLIDVEYLFVLIEK